MSSTISAVEASLINAVLEETLDSALGLGAGRGRVEALVTRLEGLAVQEPWEVIFVDDGSPDDTVERLRRRLERSSLQGLLVRHGRNDGEHNTVLIG